jgi:hypothetical protein
MAAAEIAETPAMPLSTADPARHSDGRHRPEELNEYLLSSQQQTVATTG